MIPDANGYEPKERDIPVLLDSLQELFQEYGDKVTPTELARRMEKKLHRHISPYVPPIFTRRWVLFPVPGAITRAEGITLFPISNY